MLTVDETGTLDYGQKDQNNLVLNTLETHLLTSQDVILQDTQTQDDIISLEGSNPNMNLVYQSDTTFNDIAQQLSHPITQNEETVYPNLQCSNNSKTQKIITHTQPPDTSLNKQQQNNLSHVTITQPSDHVTVPNV